MRRNEKSIVRSTLSASGNDGSGDDDRCTFDVHELEKFFLEEPETSVERRFSSEAALSHLGLSDWSCHRKRYKNRQRCIFHEENKDFHEFISEFLQELQRDKSDERLLDFTGAVFPSMFFYQAEKPLIFRKPASFVGARFGQAYFGQEEPIVFLQKHGERPLPGVTFEKEVRFDSATFLRAHFDRVTFSEEVSFEAAEFKVGATFDGAHFLTYISTADFDQTKFGGPAEFSGTEFQGLANFMSTEFQDDASFDGTIFHYAIFDYSVFQKDVSFEGAVFYKGRFVPDRIGGKCRFVNSAFLGDIAFNSLETSVSSRVEFVGDINAQHADLKTIWEQCDQLERGELAKTWGVGLKQLETTFEEGYLAMDMVSLLETDAKDMRFVNVSWGQMSGSFNVLKRTAIHDEMRLYKVSATRRNYGAVARLYRELRHNYEQELRYPEAGDFYIGEMEMRRLQTSRQHLRGWGWLRRNLLSPIAWYRNLALYGESYLLAALWIVGTILFFAILPITISQFIVESSADSLDNSFTRSVLAFFQLRSTSTLENMERILGAFLLGILFITLRRRLERH
jgi:uncharacterized protein YjbI with pentapeptide repeats